MRFPHLAHRSAAAHKLHSTPQQHRMNLISGKGETSSRLPGLFSLFLPGSCPNNRNRCTDLPPVPGTHPTTQRDHEYKRHGTVTLMAGIDLLTGTVHALVKDRHRSREFIEFLKILDTAYPAATAIKIILDNHSAHISRETKTWLAAQPNGRFAFVFTPKHGSWLNLIEGFFSKAARSVLRHIRVKSTHELKQRIIEFINDLSRDPVIHRWRYKIDLPA